MTLAHLTWAFICLKIELSKEKSLGRCEMTRLYIQPSWIDSCSDHGEWSGGNDQYRGDKSIEAVPTYINGKPNVKAFSDEAIEARKEKRKTSIPLTDRILPQAKRVNLLTEQMRELEIEYKSGKMSIQDYTLYRNILSVKRSRAEVLLKKAISVRPTPHQDDEYTDEMPEVEAQTTHSSYDVDSTDTPTPPTNWLDDFIAELPVTNSFRNPLKIALHMTRKAVEFSQKARNYINELKAV